MHSKTLKRSLAVTAAMFMVAALAPAGVTAAPARAHEAQQQTQDRRETVQQTAQTQQRGQEAQTQSQERRETGQAKLDAAKLKACQNREKAIKNIMSRISDRGAKQLDVFTKISDRTQEFYKEKGVTLNNYEALVEEVEAKKAAAEVVVEAVKNDSTEFKCDGDNPKATADIFKDNLKAMNQALKDYKTAVKDLIVGVKSAQSTATEGSTEGSQE